MDDHIKDHYQYKSAAVLIQAYNKLMKIYYGRNTDVRLKGSVNIEYKRYKECELQGYSY